MTEGWVLLDNSRRAHYFRDGMSLCGKWAYLGTVYEEDTGVGSPDDCRRCGVKRDKERSTWRPE